MFLIYLVKLIFFLIMLLISSYFFFFLINSFYLLLNFSEYFLFSNISMNFLFDYFSLLFLFTILLVLYNVMNFMSVYMFMNKNFVGFFIMTFLFMLSMLVLVFSFDLWIMIIGWEMLGMTSFYLIFYYNNDDSWNSAIKTFINNKLGDSMILISLIYLFLNNSFFFITFIILFSLLTKTAQYPFMSWLPMAMSAPTPISAMVHSSTLVTAGLYLFFRYSFYFLSSFNMYILMDLCLLSMLVSSLKGLIEKDMKKLIALSTLSQVGLIMYLFLLNFKFVAYIYMCNHAFFKSLMFMNMGYMMMNNYSNQFLFNMNIFNTSSFFNMSLKISCLNLMNMTFFSSFFLKEVLMTQIFTNFLNMLKMFVFIISSFFTMNYSLKMLFFSFSLNMNLKISFFFNNSSFMFSFFFMNITSLFFSKFMSFFMLFYMNYNFFLMFFYFLMLFLNFCIYEFNFSFVFYLFFLNFIFYSNIMNTLKSNLIYLDMWMEKLTLSYYFNFLNKDISKSFNASFKLILMFLLLMLLF
uniref:NADH dehydrogenase subunit 5 n=1 Tax=Stigmaeopsis continentalis TaxID=2547534 RepID=UPI00286D0A36|nr:NADH dehydrogenase subunit 5 [Stigmaeopsis continentalis]WKW93607.1 NADH dehydrogenase subunit 5 [Stigmaeopsis continentalis]